MSNDIFAKLYSDTNRKKFFDCFKVSLECDFSLTYSIEWSFDQDSPLGVYPEQYPKVDERVILAWREFAKDNRQIIQEILDLSHDEKLALKESFREKTNRIFNDSDEDANDGSDIESVNSDTEFLFSILALSDTMLINHMPHQRDNMIKKHPEFEELLEDTTNDFLSGDSGRIKAIRTINKAPESFVHLVLCELAIQIEYAKDKSSSQITENDLKHYQEALIITVKRKEVLTKQAESSFSP